MKQLHNIEVEGRKTDKSEDVPSSTATATTPTPGTAEGGQEPKAEGEAAAPPAEKPQQQQSSRRAAQYSPTDDAIAIAREVIRKHETLLHRTTELENEKKAVEFQVKTQAEVIDEYRVTYNK